MDYREIEEAAKEQGWRTEQKKKGLMFFPPDRMKQAVMWHGTPSDQRALKNFLAEMKRSGLIWPWPPPKRS